MIGSGASVSPYLCHSPRKLLDRKSTRLNSSHSQISYAAFCLKQTLTIAGDSVDQHLLKLIQERYPQANVTIYMVREWKEKYSFVGEAPERSLVTAPAKGVPTELDITNEIKAACETILPPVIETMLDLLSKVEPQLHDRDRANVILSGGGGLTRGLAEAMEAALKQVGGGKVTYMADPVFIGSGGGPAPAPDWPGGGWGELARVPPPPRGPER